MPLTVRVANAKTEALNSAFADIGYSAATIMPRSRSGMEAVAWEYHVSSHLLRMAEARRKKAAKAAVAAGIIFDPEVEQSPEGTNELTYSGDFVEVTLSVTAPSTRFDAEPFCEDVAKAGLARKLLDKLIKKHTRGNRPPHTFTSSLVTSRR